MDDAANAAPASTTESLVTAPDAPIVSSALPGAGVDGQAAPTIAPPALESPTAPDPIKSEPAISVLGGESIVAETPKLDAVKSEIQKSEGEKPLEEGIPSVESATVPAYEPFIAPEGMAFDDKQLGEFTAMLGEYEMSSKADHAATQKFGQDLVNRHIAAVQESVKRVTDGYIAAWNKQDTDWLDAFKADPEIGGNRADTTMKTVQEAVGKYAGTPEHVAEFRNFVNTTKVSNNVTVIRLINNMNARIEGLISKYERESSNPVPAMKSPAPVKSKIERRYGSK